MPRRHLIFDADDTLWENNRIFEEVIADFIAWLAHPKLDAAGVPLEIIDGVPETLAALAARHDLLLLTKGDDAEQRRKLAVSGLGAHFRAAVVVREKDADAYASVVAEHALDPAATWMIGNSPKSDILPALEAGLRAVFVPHEHTWSLEHAELPAAVPDGRLLTLTRFRELLDHF
jgi:putative hydrolase of the HAD superfamily